ncbi:MAG: hypothetical protein LBR26_08035, partial [Prevotella sp.]|nr:hypothetical protein [Prevotella sp.]
IQNVEIERFDKKSRMRGDFHVRFRERLGLKCPCLLDKQCSPVFLLYLHHVWHGFVHGWYMVKNA